MMTEGKQMKKLLVICALVLAAALLFVNLGALASAVQSPEASTYTTRHGRGGGTETSTRSSRTTKTVVTTKTSDNDDENDPNSPNYTGDREVTSDTSPTSPDTAAEQSYTAVIAAAGMLAAAGVCTAVITRKKVTEEN